MERYFEERMQEKLVFLEIFKSDHFSDISLAQWIGLTPNEVVRSVLNLSDEFLNHVQKESCPIVRYPGYEFPPAKGTPQNVRYFKDFEYKIKKPCKAAKEH